MRRSIRVALSAAALALCFPAAARADSLDLAGPGVTARGTVGSATAYFNPRELSTEKERPWKGHDIQGLDPPVLEFSAGEPYRVQFELYFDGYEKGESVRKLTDKIEALATSDASTGRPPVVQLRWGGAQFAARLLQANTTILAVDRRGVPSAARVQTLWSAPIAIDHDRPPHPNDLVPARIQFGGEIASPSIDASGAVAFLGDAGSPLLETVPLDAQSLRDLLSSPDAARRLARLEVPLVFDTSASGNDVSDLVQDLLDAAGPADCAGERKPLLLEVDGRFVFRAVLAASSLRYTRFLDDGTPVRATMKAVWKEYSPAQDQLKGTPRH